MISLKKHNKGFTIIELLIVIVVIGILALLVITTYSGIQAKARNAKRASDMQAVQTQLEGFFQDNGYYPSEANLSSDTWVAANMKSLDTEALNDPSDANASSTVNSVSGTAGAKKYAYIPQDSTGSSAACEANNTSCTQYTLTATYEGTYNGASTIVKKNLD